MLLDQSLDPFVDAFWKGLVLPLLIPILVLAGLLLALAALLALRRSRRLRRSGIAEIDKMSGLEFEQYVEWLFRKLGYSVERTKYQGDFGADLVISMSNFSPEDPTCDYAYAFKITHVGVDRHDVGTSSQPQ